MSDAKISIPNLVTEFALAQLDEAPETDLNELVRGMTGKEPEAVDLPLTNKTRELIAAAEAARAERGRWGGLSLGSERFHQLNTHWAGIDQGVHLVGGETNTGKTSLMRMMAWDLIRQNPKIHLRYYTLDDSEEYFLDAFVAQAAKVPINAVNKPESYIHREATPHYTQADYEHQVERGNQMYQDLLVSPHLRSFSFVGTQTLGSAEWDRIRTDILNTKRQLPEGHQLVCMVDNFHDIEITNSAGDTNERTERVATEVHKLSESERIIFIGTCELKKNQQRRPILDDIYGSRKWKYKARSILLLYSEVGVGRPNPRIFYDRPDRPGEPAAILEVHFAKAKGNEFKGRLFYRQITECGLMSETPLDEARQYALSIS